MTIELNPRKVVVCLFVIIGLVIVANILSLVSTYVFGHNYVLGLVPLFRMDAEENVPTYAASAMWLVAALLALCVTAAEKIGRRRHGYWAGLVLICLYVSLDEFTAFHERVVNASVRGSSPTSFYLSWVVVYVFVVAVVALVYLPFVLRLPKEIRKFIIIAGVVYVVGAMGFEELSGVYLTHNDGRCGPGYYVSTILEETLEMTGVTALIYALLSYAAKYAGGGGVALRIGPPRAD